MTITISTDFVEAVRKKALDYAELHALKLFAIDPVTGNGSLYAAHSNRAIWEADFAGGKLLGVSAIMSECLLFDVDVHSLQDRDEAWSNYVEFCRQIGITDANGGVPMPYAQSKSGGWHFAFRAPADFKDAPRKGHHKLKISHFRALEPGEIDSERISIRWRALNVYAGSVKGGSAYQIMPDAPPPHPYGPNTAKLFAWYSALELGRKEVTHASPTDECRQSEAECAKLERFINELLVKDPHWFDDRDNRLGTVWGIKRAGFGGRGYEIAQIICDATPDKKGDRLARYWFDVGALAGTKTLDSFWKRCAAVGIKQKPAEIAEWRRDATMQSFATVPGVQVLSPSLAPSLPPGATPMIGGATWQQQAAPPEYSEIEVADRFANMYALQIRYVTKRKKWLHWNGKRWHDDDTDYIGHLAKLHCKDEAALCSISPGNTNAQARALCSDKTIRAVLRIAAVDPRISSTVAAWDQNAWILGTPDGVVELRTGVFRPARPEDHVTKSTRVSPHGDCPIWKKFLARATGGDLELQEYLQRLCGYILTGDTSEESLHFNYGPGGGGKGTYMHAIEGILGDYHVGTSIATLTESKQERHLTEIASLQGARLVTCSETERGKRWAESRIKELTGRDTITARFMGCDPFNFIPTFKIQVSGNHKPSLRPDSAMRRRFQLVPFTTSIAESEKDTKLGEKLKAEWPGILAWMIAGCVAWQREGLAPPAIVVDATDAYMNEESEDCMSAWLAESCDTDPAASTPSAVLYSSYKHYAERSGEKPMSNVEFGKEIRRLHFKVERGRRGAVVDGLKLALPAVPTPMFPEVKS
ncbi:MULTISPECIES: phage/plasmid primase, P4 family [Rhodopseudomonas]|uniref:phage/plasmid primase, P4 family n=1 Tax=Rhodopseudomonas TaxID=1073 RepID=UPI0006967D84|nr:MULTISPECIES: phage/plasmid primase, P4 family [Rhodopseudomonas]MDF3810552.1 phage/plasmid primase, P4 family [Rhodopseudomonas sp. BAL398]WOK18390.1 phage/plasmid primase, P4 family [Rhodopseudomonas sp. BAL398]